MNWFSSGNTTVNSREVSGILIDLYYEGIEENGFTKETKEMNNNQLIMILSCFD